MFQAMREIGIARLAGLLAMAIAFAVLPLTAVGITLGGATLFLATFPGAGRRASVFLAALLGLYGVALLCDATWHVEVGFERELWQLLSQGYPSNGPVLPSKLSSIAMALFALGILALDLEVPRGPRPADLLGFAAGLIGYLAIVAFITEAHALSLAGFTSRIALPTACAFLVLGAGILAARPDRGFHARLMAQDPGGMLLRRFLPLAVAFPPALAYLRILAERAGWIDTAVGIAMLTLGFVALSVPAILLMAHDLTLLHAEVGREYAERARLQAEISRRDAEVRAAREAARLKDAFLSSLSHEIKTPLSIIVGYGELLQDRYPGDAHVEGMLEGTRRLIRHVQDLLDYAALVGGSLPLYRSEVCFPEIITEALASLGGELESRRQAISLELGREVPCISGDSRRLGQVIRILVDNASRFSPDNARITVRLARRDAAIEVEVADEGIGMTEEELQRVSEPFGQARDGDATRTGGLGLGLKIARALVELHGGALAVISSPGRGTRAIASFPAEGPVPAGKRQ